MGGPLLLWDTFFGDFSTLTSELELSAEVTPQGPRLALRQQVPDGPVLNLQVDPLADGGRGYGVHLELADLASFHQRYLQVALSDLVGDIELGGSLDVRIEGEMHPQPGPSTLHGSVRLAGGRASGRSGVVAAEGVDLELPLDLAWQGDELQPASAEQPGRLAFEALRVRDLQLPATATGLVVSGDSLRLEQPLSIPLLGGAVELERLSLNHLLRPDRYLGSALRLSGIRLEAISEALGLFPLEGAVDGYLPRVRLAGDQLQVEGGGQVALFGGVVRVGDISGRDILSGYPRLTFSAEFQDIDLGQLTRKFDFGEMTGVLQGSVRHCELFRGVPVRLEAQVETVQRKGVKRRVSVKAVSNIAILGTGQRPTLLDLGIRRFLRFYTYDRLGIEAQLVNDVFLLRGLEHRGDQELFLKGRLPLPIDVVNAQPGRTVSFRTMLRRLESLDFGAVTTSPR